jgi:hypothetical protein
MNILIDWSVVLSTVIVTLLIAVVRYQIKLVSIMAQREEWIRQHEKSDDERHQTVIDWLRYLEGQIQNANTPGPNTFPTR